MENLKLSLITPVFNEAESLPELVMRIDKVCLEHGYDYEIIAVNDCSGDDSLAVLKRIAETNKRLKIISFRRRFGQTAGITAGIKNSSGDILIPIDSDLENDPADIANLIAKINEGFDVVSGWRKERWENNRFSRKLPSMIANYLISRVSKVKLHDYGCTLKAYKRDVVENVNLYGEMHRFIPAYAALYGARVTEIAVRHEPRKFGQSKYNLNRTFKVFYDLITLTFISRYFDRPMYFFGKFGFLSFAASIFSGLLAFFFKFVLDISFISTPLPMLTVFLIMIGVQFILMGLLAEILIRIYYESNDRQAYLIKEKINF